MSKQEYNEKTQYNQDNDKNNEMTESQEWFNHDKI